MRARRILVLASLALVVGFAAALAAAPLEVTYYYLPT